MRAIRCGPRIRRTRCSARRRRARCRQAASARSVRRWRQRWLNLSWSTCSRATAPGRKISRRRCARPNGRRSGFSGKQRSGAGTTRAARIDGIAIAMSQAALVSSRRIVPARRTSLQRLISHRDWQGFWFMLPAVAILVLFLAYPLGLGVWLSFTDAKIGRARTFVGLENYDWLSDDTTFWMATAFTVGYTLFASAIKFAVGLYLALLLNKNLPFKAVLRSIVLIPFVVPTVLSAIAFWWIFDAQFSIISWTMRHLGLIDHNINFLGDSWNARMCVIFANIWRGVPFIAITLLAGLQTVSPSLYEAATIDGASRWQNFRFITYPLLTPIIAVVMTFSVLFTFTDFQLIWAMTRGGPVNATHLMATLSYQRAILGGNLGEGAAISTAMVPFLLAAIMVSWFGLQRRKWQQGSE